MQNYTMNPKQIQDILPLVEQPSRYLGSEINRIKKNPAGVDLRVALAFPDLYEIGTSHFGLQILYDILNQQDAIAAERVFTPAVDMEQRLREAGIPLTSLESQTPLGEFDIIGFSLLYELDFTNILTMLDLSGIPFYAKERTAEHPLMIAGGPCTCNPEPVADFFDAIVVGDGEEVLPEMCRVRLEQLQSGSTDRAALLKKWSAIDGVYIPSFFEADWDDNGFQTLTPLHDDYTQVRRAVISDLDAAPFPESPVIPYARPVHDRLRLEVARGCTRGCRFCQAGMLYRPVRERSPKTLLRQLERALAATGYEDISLLSLSTGDYSCINSLLAQIMTQYKKDHLAVSLPSLRAGTLTPELMDLIRQVRKTGFTIAPEAGSQRLRDVINKNISHEEILKTVENAFQAGWQVIKLYFMVGLPTETDADLEAIVSLVKELKKFKGPKGRKGKINVSVGTLIPKSHTPFQWEPQLSLDASRQKIEWLKSALKMPGVQFKWQTPEVSFLEGLWARGDRRLSSLLVTAWEKGCRFDGWSDQFRFDLWQDAFEAEGTDTDFYITRKRSKDEPLPWDHIDSGVSKAFLKEEFARAEAGEGIGDCRNGICNDCGVCDFDRIEPVVFDAADAIGAGEGTPSASAGPEDNFKILQIAYAKTGAGRFFGHLEMVSIFIRAIRRAGIPVKYSQGFHPMPKMAFNDPLPVGVESEQEHFYLTVPGHVRPRDVGEKINQLLPEGLQVLRCVMAPPKSARKRPDTEQFRFTFPGGLLDEKYITRFDASDAMPFERTSRKGKTISIDLKKAVADIQIIGPDEVKAALSAVDGRRIRPRDVLASVFHIPEESIPLTRIIKLGASETHG